MRGKVFPLIVILLASACEPVDYSSMEYPQEITQIPFYASETPSFIIPITETPTISHFEDEDPQITVPFTGTRDTISFIKWSEVYFTDPEQLNDPDRLSGSIEEKLIQLINNAQSSVHIASFEFNLPRVADALIAAKARGVDVRWVTDNENGLDMDSQPGRGQFTRLMEAGIEGHDDAGRTALMHNKFWIFDKNITWTGSTNITVNGIYKQNNNVLVLHSPKIGLIFEREWEELWTSQFGPRAPSTINNQWAILDGSPVLALFSPEDGVLNNLIALTRDARSSIRFLAFSFTDYPLAKTMIDRAQAGVDVQGVFENFGSNSPRAELKTFLCADVPVKQDGNPSFLHDKIIIIDNSIIVTGSLNFSSSADEENEENVIILENPEIAALYLQEYEKIWNQGTNPDPAEFPCQ